MPMKMSTVDVCVIGAGGVVGSAILRDLARRGMSVIGVEKHDAPARGASGFNSRVVHSGFHEKSGTLKAQLALAGSRMLVDYASSKDVPLLRTGMLIAIPKGAIRHGLWRELDSLWRLWRGGREHNVHFEWIVSPAAVRRIAPIEAIGGIFIPSVCVIDVNALITSLQGDATKSGAEIRYESAVERISARHDQFAISTSTQEVAARLIVNSAGLAAPVISRMAGGLDYVIEPIRGEYYELRGGVERWNIRPLIYPATPSRSRSKGIHFGPRTDGRLFIGPDAAPADAPSTPKRVFLEAAQKFLPQISDDDLEYCCAGVRPKYTRRDGVSDFSITLDRRDPPLINLIGIDSPGLSASLAIAEYVGELAARNLGFKKVA
jgi:glycerol-3-phosphate dehydrogenase